MKEDKGPEGKKVRRLGSWEAGRPEGQRARAEGGKVRKTEGQKTRGQPATQTADKRSASSSYELTARREIIDQKEKERGNRN